MKGGSEKTEFAALATIFAPACTIVARPRHSLRRSRRLAVPRRLSMSTTVTFVPGNQRFTAFFCGIPFGVRLGSCVSPECATAGAGTPHSADFHDSADPFTLLERFIVHRFVRHCNSWFAINGFDAALALPGAGTCGILHRRRPTERGHYSDHTGTVDGTGRARGGTAVPFKLYKVERHRRITVLSRGGNRTPSKGSRQCKGVVLDSPCSTVPLACRKERSELRRN